MSVFALTKAQIKQRIETLVRRLKNGDLTYLERELIDDAIELAAVDMCGDYHVNRFDFAQRVETATTVAGNDTITIACADDTWSPLSIRNAGFVIVDPPTSLSPMTPESAITLALLATDTGLPKYYSVSRTTTSSDTMTIKLIPTPDKVYSIKITLNTIIDADAASDFPVFMLGAFKDKATENALRDLGHLNESMAYAASYDRRLASVSGNYDGPQFIPRTGYISHY